MHEIRSDIRTRTRVYVCACTYIGAIYVTECYLKIFSARNLRLSSDRSPPVAEQNLMRSVSASCPHVTCHVIDKTLNSVVRDRITNFMKHLAGRGVKW